MKGKIKNWRFVFNICIKTTCQMLLALKKTCYTIIFQQDIENNSGNQEKI